MLCHPIPRSVLRKYTAKSKHEPDAAMQSSMIYTVVVVSLFLTVGPALMVFNKQIFDTVRVGAGLFERGGATPICGLVPGGCYCARKCAQFVHSYLLAA